jgi:hypothetical protein
MGSYRPNPDVTPAMREAGIEIILEEFGATRTHASWVADWIYTTMAEAAVIPKEKATREDDPRQGNEIAQQSSLSQSS